MTPLAYTWFRRGGVRLLVRDDVVTALAPWLLTDPVRPPADSEAIASGRGGAFRASFRGPLRVVVRPCRRGGLLGRLLTRTYLGWRPRPMRELDVSLQARARGVPTPAVLAVRVRGWGLYRGIVVTEEIAAATTLADALAAAPTEAHRRMLAHEAGEAIGLLHAAGVDHADLNLGNVLVSPTPDGAAQIVDLDKARLTDGPLGLAARRRNLARLHQSWRRVMKGAPLSGDVREAFRAGYEATGGARCAS
jgi:tRNA A-37 threonylcarbamoyl transferase component Bud32